MTFLQMIPVSPSCFSNGSEGIHNPNQLYPDVAETSSGGAGGGGGGAGGGSETQVGSLLCSLSVLKEKVNQVQSMTGIFLSPETHHQVRPALASMTTLIQEIIVTASSMMFNCQQMAIVGPPQGGSTNDDNNNGDDNSNHNHLTNNVNHLVMPAGDGASGSNNNHQGFFEGENFYNWYSDSINFNTSTNNNNSNNNNDNNNNTGAATTTMRARVDNCRTTTTTTTMATTMTTAKVEKKSCIPTPGGGKRNTTEQGYDIVELDAADLLAKYTHYCQVCGKGFKRDANLRMHMRAHGDEYKSPSALSNPLKNSNNINLTNINTNSGSGSGSGSDIGSSIRLPRKYSCPQEGCRWNKKHAKFQPLKSMICVKNHYKRSHCPKMYVCKRCNRKQFSVLSDLRTHEKHCGDLKWQCSCGTTFSRKDKLMGHVALFIGHSPVINPLGLSAAHKLRMDQGMEIQFQER